jgi:hypothetical protein
MAEPRLEVGNRSSAETDGSSLIPTAFDEVARRMATTVSLESLLPLLLHIDILWKCCKICCIITPDINVRRIMNI